MQIGDIELHLGDLDRPYRVVAEINARVVNMLDLGSPPPVDDADSALREVAVKVGANAVIWVEYGHTTGPWRKRSTYALGTAVIAAPRCSSHGRC